GGVLMLGRGGRQQLAFPEPIPCSHASGQPSARSATLEPQELTTKNENPARAALSRLKAGSREPSRLPAVYRVLSRSFFRYWGSSEKPRRAAPGAFLLARYSRPMQREMEILS